MKANVVIIKNTMIKSSKLGFTKFGHLTIIPRISETVIVTFEPNTHPHYSNKDYDKSFNFKVIDVLHELKSDKVIIIVK